MAILLSSKGPKFPVKMMMFEFPNNMHFSQYMCLKCLQSFSKFRAAVKRGVALTKRRKRGPRTDGWVQNITPLGEGHTTSC